MISNTEPALSGVQRSLLHSTLRDIHHAREKLRGVILMQRYGGQPQLVGATQEISSHLQQLWHLVDGLDPVKTTLAEAVPA